MSKGPPTPDPDIEELPTIRISPAEVPQALRDLDVTCDSLPAELLSQALPFVAPTAPEEQTIECQVTSLPPALPFSTFPILSFSCSPSPSPSPSSSPSSFPSPSLSPAPAPSPSSEVTRVAELAAQVAFDKKRTLAHEGISPEAWASMEEACTAKLAADLEAGRTNMRDAYDSAFLETRAAHRGAFGPTAFEELRKELEKAELSPGLALDVADAIRFKRVLSAAS